MSVLIFYIAQPQEDFNMQEDEDEGNRQEQQKEMEMEQEKGECFIFSYLLSECVDLLYSPATGGL